MKTGGMGTTHALLRAILIGTVLQMGLVLAGHTSPAIAKLFPVLGMLFSLIAGFLFGLWMTPAGRGAAVAGGLVAGAVCALLGILESFYLRDVPAWVIVFGTCTSAVTGAIGGFLGRVARRT